ncbi:hypothetical protein BU15DRAFT_67252 [Melanogaster broomeanus]|nr:hypothetical protein BU15DRAFT_67252 [Melanogaster broomeanus]
MPQDPDDRALLWGSERRQGSTAMLGIPSLLAHSRGDKDCADYFTNNRMDYPVFWQKNGRPYGSTHAQISCLKTVIIGFPHCEASETSLFDVASLGGEGISRGSQEPSVDKAPEVEGTASCGPLENTTRVDTTRVIPLVTRGWSVALNFAYGAASLLELPTNSSEGKTLYVRASVTSYTEDGHSSCGQNCDSRHSGSDLVSRGSTCVVESLRSSANPLTSGQLGADGIVAELLEEGREVLCGVDTYRIAANARAVGSFPAIVYARSGATRVTVCKAQLAGLGNWSK